MSDQAPTPPHERELFLCALDKLPSERAAFLAEACGGDDGLRRRVEELLLEQRSLGAFLEQPALANAAGPSALEKPGGTVSEQAGQRIGRYKLLQKIGEGGCGVVYMAEQEE